MGAVAIVGNLARDRVDGGRARPGGCPSFAADALLRLAHPGQIVTRFAEPDEALFRPFLHGLGVPVTLLPSASTSGFALDYDGEERSMRVTSVGQVWTPEDAETIRPDVVWVHAAPLLRSDFPAETLAALARSRRVSLDAQGLVRVPRKGPLQLDASFDPNVLRHVTALKLAEEEARIVAGGPFDHVAVESLGVPEVLLTLGSHGAVVYADGDETFVPAAWPVLGVQTTGAGDIFMVAYAVARGDGLSPVDAAAKASRLVAETLEDRKQRRA